MKEIKFRAWDKKLESMCEPLNISWRRNDIECVHHAKGHNGGFYLFNGEDGADYELMQYTGLKDKNGKEIYEGDILVIVIKENIGTFNVPDDVIANGGVIGEDVFESKIIFKNGCFGIEDEEHGFLFLTDPRDCKYEIIGNIYENPELKEIE